VSPGSEKICIVAKTFVDTNIFVYALDNASPQKQVVARSAIRQLLSSADGVVSTQVLQEFYNVATRKLGHPALQAKELVQSIGQNELVVVDLALIQSAIDLSILNPISFWDGLIIAAAAAANCSQLLTEDLQDGMVFAGVKIVNPFTKATP
jgi:predicted nucleic acid-binding protein